MDCKLEGFQNAVTNLVVFIEKHRNPYYGNLKDLSKKVKTRMKILKGQVQNSNKAGSLKSKCTRHKIFTENEWDGITRENNLTDEIKHFDATKHAVLERECADTETPINVKVKEKPVSKTERMRLNSYIFDLAEKIKGYKTEVTGLTEQNLRHKHVITEMEEQLQLYKQNFCLQESLTKSYEKDKIITSQEISLEKDCVEIDHLRESPKSLEVKIKLSAKEENTKDALLEKNKLLEMKTVELSNKITMLLNSSDNMNKQLSKTQTLETEIKRKEADLCKQERQRDQLLQELRELHEEVILMRKKNREMQTNAVKKDQIINDLKRDIENMNTECSTINNWHMKVVTEKDKVIKELHQSIVESNRKISDLTNTERSLNSDIRDKDEHNVLLNDKHKRCTKLLNKKELELRNMENKVQTAKNNLSKDSEFKEKEIAQKDKILIDEIDDRMSQLKSKIDALGKEIKEKDTQIYDLNVELQQCLNHEHKAQEIHESNEKVILDLKQEVEKRGLIIDSLKKKLEQDSSGNLSGKEHKIDAAVTNEIRDLKKQLNHTLSKLHDTQVELDDTKTRLSKAMGNRLTDNNPNITDLSDRNRPTKLAEKCAELYDNQWTDAFEILEKYFSTDEAVIESLLHILQATMNFCQKTAQNQLEELEKTLQLADNKENTDVSNSVKKQLKDTRKASALSALGNLGNMFVSYLRQSADQTVTKALEIEEFTFECLELCWFMMVNDPPVAFAPLLAKGTHFNSDLYKPYTSSGTHVEYIVWPALLLHEGGPILAKGVAQGISKSKKNAFN